METGRPETALLLRCASARLGPEEGSGLADALQKGLDWELLFRLAVRHRVVPLVFHNLSKWAAPRAPEGLLGRLRSLHLGNLAGNVRKAGALAGIMTALEAAGIRAAAYKGAVLAVSAYGDLGLRTFNDLDVFVGQGDVLRALELLAVRGYRMAGTSAAGLSPPSLRLLRDVVLRDREGRVALEIQWRLAQRYHPVFREPGDLLRRSVRLEVQGAALRTFSAEDTLILLCLHGLYHAWSQLQMVCDVAEHLRSARLDPGLVLELAGENRAHGILFLGLHLARRLLDAPLPNALLDAARADRYASSLSRDLERRFFDAEPAASRARRLFFREALLLPGFGSRVRYFAGRLLTPNEEDLAGRAPTCWRRLLLPVLRLLRLFRSYVLQDKKTAAGARASGRYES